MCYCKILFITGRVICRYQQSLIDLKTYILGELHSHRADQYHIHKHVMTCCGVLHALVVVPTGNHFRPGTIISGFGGCDGGAAPH